MVLKYKNNSINKISSCKFTAPGEHYLAKSTFSTIMPNTRRHSYNLNFKLKIVAVLDADDELDNKFDTDSESEDEQTPGSTQLKWFFSEPPYLEKSMTNTVYPFICLKLYQ